MKNIIKKLSIFITVYVVSILFYTFIEDAYVVSDNYESLEMEYYNELIDSSVVDGDSIDTSSIIIDNLYTEIVLNQFIEDAEKNGLNRTEVIKHINALDRIIVDDLNRFDLLGVTFYRNDTMSPTGLRAMIIINENLLYDPELYMFTLYHELGHWFGLPHTKNKNNIMMNGYDEKAIDKIFSVWDKRVTKLMKNIESGWDKKSNNYSFPSFEE